MPEMNLFGGTTNGLITLLNATTATGFSIDDAGGSDAVAELMTQAESWVLEALPDEAVRLLRQVDDEILCRRALGTETQWTLGGWGGIAHVNAGSVRLFRFAEREAESFFNAARAMSRQQFLSAVCIYEIEANQFTASADAVSHKVTVELGAEISPADEGYAFVAAYEIDIGAEFEESGLKRLLLTRAGADVACRLGMADTAGQLRQEAEGLLGAYARLERLPWSRKKLDLVRDRAIRPGALRNRISVGRCVRA